MKKKANAKKAIVPKVAKVTASDLKKVSGGGLRPMRPGDPGYEPPQCTVCPGDE